MIAKHFNRLIEVLTQQERECRKLAEAEWQHDNIKGHAFQTGAAEALKRASEYAKDAQAGVL